MSKYEYRVMQDEMAEDPREWDNMGTMVTWHRRYTLGDKQPSCDPSEWLNDYLAAHPDAVVLPLYLYDHSGITMRTTSFSCPWDSGQVGYIVVSTEKLKHEFGWKNMTKARRQQAIEILEHEVKIYDQWLTGDVYWYVIDELDDDGLVIDSGVESCGGYYSREDCEKDAQAMVEWYEQQSSIKAQQREFPVATQGV
jgi:hypothetical protein